MLILILVEEIILLDLREHTQEVRSTGAFRYQVTSLGGDRGLMSDPCLGTRMALAPASCQISAIVLTID